MSRSDMMPLWTDAYLADTQDLDAIQHGMYFLLIIRAWRSGEARLKDDERGLANIARVSLAQWRKHSPAIMAYWTLKDGYWEQKRLSELWSEREGFKKSQSKRRKNSEQSSKIFQKRIAKKPNENNETGVTKAEAVAVADISSCSPARVDDFDWLGVRALCLKACEGILRPDVVAYIDVNCVKNWMMDAENPLDLQLDILPAMRAIAARGSPSDLTSFRYFHKIAIQNRDERLAGNPAPQTPESPKNDKYSKTTSDKLADADARRREASALALERVAAKRARMGGG